MFTNLLALAVKMFKKTPPPFASPTCQQDLWSPARMNAPRCKTAKMPCGSYEPVCWTWHRSPRISTWLTCVVYTKKQNGAARSGLTCCIPTRWSKTTAPITRLATACCVGWRPRWFYRGLLETEKRRPPLSGLFYLIQNLLKFEQSPVKRFWIFQPPLPGELSRSHLSDCPTSTP